MRSKIPSQDDLPLEIDPEQIRPELRELLLGGGARKPGINLRDLGFVGRVSDEARAEIEANERRAQRVISTAHRYWFGATGGGDGR